MTEQGNINFQKPEYNKITWYPVKIHEAKTSVDRDVKKVEPSDIAGGSVKWNSLWKSLPVPQKVTLWLSVYPIPFLEPQSKGTIWKRAKTEEIYPEMRDMFDRHFDLKTEKRGAKACKSQKGLPSKLNSRWVRSMLVTVYENK